MRSHISSASSLSGSVPPALHPLASRLMSPGSVLFRPTNLGRRLGGERFCSLAPASGHPAHGFTQPCSLPQHAHTTTSRRSCRHGAVGGRWQEAGAARAKPTFTRRPSSTVGPVMVVPWQPRGYWPMAKWWRPSFAPAWRTTTRVGAAWRVVCPPDVRTGAAAAVPPRPLRSSIDVTRSTPPCMDSRIVRHHRPWCVCAKPFASTPTCRHGAWIQAPLG